MEIISPSSMLLESKPPSSMLPESKGLQPFGKISYIFMPRGHFFLFKLKGMQFDATTELNIISGSGQDRLAYSTQDLWDLQHMINDRKEYKRLSGKNTCVKVDVCILDIMQAMDDTGSEYTRSIRCHQANSSYSQDIQFDLVYPYLLVPHVPGSVIHGIFIGDLRGIPRLSVWSMLNGVESKEVRNLTHPHLACPFLFSAVVISDAFYHSPSELTYEITCNTLHLWIMNVYVCVWRESERVCVKESESTFLSVGVKHNASSHVSNKWVTRQTHSIGAFFIQEEI